MAEWKRPKADSPVTPTIKEVIHMVNQEVNLAGAWRSSFDLNDGETSRHTLNLNQAQPLRYEGASRPDESGSYLSVELWVRREKTPEGVKRSVVAFWREETSKRGKYNGQIFHGVGSLALNETATALDGHWSGHNSTYIGDNSGKWTLDKIADENA